MKLILAQPATQRFKWELDVLLTNISQFIADVEVVLLFTEHDFTVPIHFREKWGCSVFSYSDGRDDGSYVPSVRPWLLWQYFAEDPAREQETYFYIDSDVIFREWIDFATLDIRPETVVGSDVSGYLNYDYVVKCQRGAEIAKKMAEICGISVEQMKNVPGIGAHLIFSKLSADFWKRCYFDSNKIWHYFEGVDSNIQKWTAEMWAQQWGWIREGRTLIAPAELDFCTATDDIAEYEQNKIMHNAGVLANMSFEYFFKGQYVNTSPLGRDLSFVRKDKCTYEYVKAVQKVVL